MRIMIVDDSRAMRMIVSRALRQAGFGTHEIVQAEDAMAALDMIDEEVPDLILCDWNMPGMSGLDLLRELNSAGRTRHFGFITSESNSEQWKEAFGEGAQFVIGKPFTPDKLRRTLEPIVGVAA